MPVSWEMPVNLRCLILVFSNGGQDSGEAVEMGLSWRKFDVQIQGALKDFSTTKLNIFKEHFS